MRGEVSFYLGIVIIVLSLAGMLCGRILLYIRYQELKVYFEKSYKKQELELS